MPPPSPPLRSSPTTRRKSSAAKSSSGLPPIPPSQSASAPAKPSVSQFVLVVIISLFAEAAAQTIASTFGSGELAAISRRNASHFTTIGLVTWKSTLLGIYWFGGFDGELTVFLEDSRDNTDMGSAVDVASLSTLLQTPIFILLHYFYTISATTLVTTHTISILSPALPFYLFRPLSAPHSSAAPQTRSHKLRNRTIIFDPITTLATSIAATIFLGSTLAASFISFLPTWLIVHFAGLRDLTFAYGISNTLPALFMWLLPAGVASTQFLFRPAEGASASCSNTATGANSVALARSHFDPATATFSQHIYHNVWGWYTSRQKELISRTIVLCTLLVAETTISIWGTIEGVEFVGALGYAGVWLGGVVISAVFLDWVGGASD